MIFDRASKTYSLSYIWGSGEGSLVNLSLRVTLKYLRGTSSSRFHTALGRRQLFGYAGMGLAPHHLSHGDKLHISLLSLIEMIMIEILNVAKLVVTSILVALIKRFIRSRPPGSRLVTSDVQVGRPRTIYVQCLWGRRLYVTKYDHFLEFPPSAPLYPPQQA